MKKTLNIIVFLILIPFLAGCGNTMKNNNNTNEAFNLQTKVYDVINDNAFEGFGNLIFPVDRNIPKDMTLENAGDLYIWYNNINPNKTVEIVNYMKDQTTKGNKIFYNIYSKEEMEADPEKKNTGLFFFRGNENSKFAVLNAGGGFMYVGAMHDSFPHTLELSKKGYNAFALIYRPDPEKAMEDLSNAISFIFDNADELKIDTSGYSVWGGSAGGRMAAWLGSYGTDYFINKDYPKPSTVIMQYTSLSEVTGNEPATYSVVGTNDGIADYRIMQERTNRIRRNGTDAKIEIFEGLSHGFGLGEGTNAQGWIENAVKFWEEHM
ncbi:alpha/beta hydrolase [Anaerofustis sp. NSJ-163]|uniref:alpha/beta hydrolase n=1 Tax=Anaerofustis sp. NSJ-163 TaxID=2944391 RepID=UPI00209C18DC|nr:alpha/beta hydrolase [Anaerofustis sp. NSJ-163]MCO8193038.1 alpha/beta hydrolase [Anaerofustis sp. NSJ-163]